MNVPFGVAVALTNTHTNKYTHTKYTIFTIATIWAGDGTKSLTDDGNVATYQFGIGLFMLHSGPVQTLR